MNKLPNLIILGSQGSGKGTQARLLAENFGYQIVASGDLIRKRIKKDDKSAKKLEKDVVSGKLVDDEILFSLIEEELSKLDFKKPIIFDGSPRNIDQKVLIDKLIEKYQLAPIKVIYLNISESESIKRIATRKTCLKCNKVYYPKIKGFKENKCTECGVGLEIRKDDTDEAVKQRLKIFHDQTLPIIEEYRKQGVLIEIDGMPSVEKVNRNIKSKILK